jgi:transcriptional regulator with XRE-family HTH domain
MKERFKEIRQKRKMTQRQFAELLEANQQSITDIETGKKNISIELLDILGTKLQINLNWLICGMGKMYASFSGYELNEPGALYGKDIHTKDVLIETLQDQVIFLKEDNLRLKKKCGEVQV